MFEPPQVTYPGPSEDPRFTNLISDQPGDMIIAGVPYDVSVVGRKGTRYGPTGIREAFRFLGNHDRDSETNLAALRIQDVGDVAGISSESDVLLAHAKVRDAVGTLWGDKPVVLLGGDHGLTFPHVQSFRDHVEGKVGIVVIDAHYDLRSWSGQPSSGTPFRRILEELNGRVDGNNLVEVGIRPYANNASLAAYADAAGVTCVTAEAVRQRGMADVAKEAIEVAGDGVEHLWMSVDIDGFDQSIASGCSAPGAGGLTYEQGAELVRVVASDSRCRAMDILEVAPELDPTGNTCRTAAQLVAEFAGVVARRLPS